MGAGSSKGAGARGAQDSPSNSRRTSERRSIGPQDAEAFPKQSRLLKRWEFLRIQRRGLKIHTRSLLILVGPNRLGRKRLGIAVSRKYGKSVQRNRIKRVVREVFRRNRGLFPDFSDIVVVPKRMRRRAKYADLVEEIRGMKKVRSW